MLRHYHNSLSCFFFLLIEELEFFIIEVNDVIEKNNLQIIEMLTYIRSCYSHFLIAYAEQFCRTQYHPIRKAKNAK